jgi:hypothetical protein
MFRMTVEDFFDPQPRGRRDRPRGKRRTAGRRHRGDNIGVLFKGIEKGQFERGSVITAAGEFPAIEEMGFVV